MKNEQNQQVRTIGIVSMFGLLMICFLVASPVWKSPFAEKTEKTMHRAESLGYQILAARKGSFVKARTPASELPSSHLEAEEGDIGLDAWGRPYHFKWVHKPATPSRLVVWSLGPNGQTDTSNEKLDSDREKEGLHFDGDDVGIMLIIK